MIHSSLSDILALREELRAKTFVRSDDYLEQTKITYRARVITDMSSVDWDWFVTLTFAKEQTDYDKVSQMLRRLVDLISRDIYKRNKSRRLTHFTIIEIDRSGKYHAHMLVQQPKDRDVELKELFRNHWQRISGTVTQKSDSTDSEWFKPVTDVNRLIDYLTKDYKHRDDYANYELVYIGERDEPQ